MGPVDRKFATVVIFLAVGASGQQQLPLPDLPADIPRDSIVRIALLGQTPCGQDVVWTSLDGSVHEFFQFNDRGRGPKIYSIYHVGPSGLILSEESKGFDYMKSPVDERFSLIGDKAVWKNQAEDVNQANANGKLYIDINGGPEEGAILARALLISKGRDTLPVLPSGTASVRKRQSVVIEGKGRKRTASLYEIAGLGYTPTYLWLDEDRQFLASISGWLSVIQHGFEASVPALRESQQNAEFAQAAELARALTHKPSGDLIISNVTLFDSQKGILVPDQRVTVRGDHIAAIERDHGQHAAEGAEVIDGNGKTLLPGLWDMHAHLFAENAFLDIATGVTTVRDLGNPIDELTKLRQRIDGGTQIGPRVVPAGLIDGPGPFEGPIKVLAATPQEARQRVDHYADLGYVQIKIYSSVKPELVPVIIDEAHRRGLRVSGHVPSGMIAEQFVRDGADEIQHMNFIFLNFMPDVKETRTPARLIEPGKRGADLDLNSQQVNQFIALLREHHTVIDPTMGVWENIYLDRPGQVARAAATIFNRLPVQVQRNSKSGEGALEATDPATDARYRSSYANMVRMLKKLYDSGIQIVAGTDRGSGYAFDRELEIYSEAGIPAPQILRMATFEAARVMHKDQDFGSITVGKFADMILVNGNPTRHISDIRNIAAVIKNGEVYRPSQMYQAYGIRPN